MLTIFALLLRQLRLQLSNLGLLLILLRQNYRSIPMPTSISPALVASHFPNLIASELEQG